MSDWRLLFDTAEEALVIQDVDYLFGALDDPIGLRIVCNNGRFSFVVNGDDDSIEIHTEQLNDFPAESIWVSASASELWQHAIGATVVWLWVLSNQQGYEDAAQIEFYNASSGANNCVQFVARASSLEFRTITRIEIHSSIHRKTNGE